MEAASHFLVEGAVEGGVVSADQAFERSVKQYEFAMEQQKLKREDIRDLVELTVGRMDVYHLVGALMLEFCIHFYCENKLAENTHVQHWLLNLFLLSNISAIGFLIFAVWLSMHASVAAHSVGVRLLLNYTRVTAPNPAELRDLQASMTLLSRVKNKFNSVVDKKPKPPESDARAATRCSVEPAMPLDPLSRPLARRTSLSVPARAKLEEASLAESKAIRSSPSHTARAMLEEANAAGINTAAMAFDQEHHKRKFQAEQAKWLSYDAYARTCMAIGINQMLQALSYFIVGSVELVSPTGAFVCLVAVQVLAMLLLRIDVVSDSDDPHTEGAHLCRDHPRRWYIPALVMLPVLLAGTIVLVDYKCPPEANDVLAFCATPCFILHGMWVVVLRKKVAPNEDMVPPCLRTVCYLDVLHADQIEQCANAARTVVDQMKDQQERLRSQVREVLRREKETGMSLAARTAPHIKCTRAEIKTTLNEVIDSDVASGDSSVRGEILNVEQSLRLLELWMQVPKMYTELEALRKTQAWHDDGFEARFAEFRQLCLDLDIGMGAQTSETQSSGGSEQSLHEQDRASGTDKTMVSRQLAAWVTRAQDTRDAQNNFQTNPLMDAVARTLPVVATPSKPLPWLIVKTFINTVAVLWVVGAMLHVVRVFTHFEHPMETLTTSHLDAPYPHPARLFEVTDLHCNSSMLHISGRFSLHAARRLHDTEFSTASDVGFFERATMVCNGAWGCDVLHAVAQQRAAASGPGVSTWRMARFVHPVGGSRASATDLPHEWRVVSAVWEQCASHQCDVAVVAGWDGAREIVVGTLQWGATDDAWFFRRRFAVRPDLSPCSHRSDAVGYDDVRALQLGAGGATLTVLLASGELDVWNLDAGTCMGRWRLPGTSHTAMCHDGTDVFVSRPGPAGPTLEVGRLPEVLLEHRPQATSAVFSTS